MHELSIASELHRVCRREVDAQGGGRLARVRVEVGELSAIEPDLLVFAWQAVIADGLDEGARLDVIPVRARQLCERCGEIAERQPGTWLRLCPTCEDFLHVEGGRELDVVQMAFDPAEPLEAPAETAPTR